MVLAFGAANLWFNPPASLSPDRNRKCPIPVQTKWCPWQDSHLHEWRVSGARYGLPDLDSDAEDESGVRLLEVAAEGDRLTYLYDFGDSWEHTVSVDAVLSPEDAGAVPRCEAGERACPPEDVGGAPGYAELVTALREPDAASEWGQMLAAAHTDFHPERFSLPTLTGAGTSRT